MTSKVSSNHDDSVRDTAEQVLSVVMSKQPPFCQAVTNCHGCLPGFIQELEEPGKSCTGGTLSCLLHSGHSESLTQAVGSERRPRWGMAGRPNLPEFCWHLLRDDIAWNVLESKMLFIGSRDHSGKERFRRDTNAA